MTYIKTSVGFSIELTNYKLEKRGSFDELPLYEVLGGKIDVIALVNEPAIESHSFLDENKRNIIAPVMIPEKKIYRNNGLYKGEKCYWYFSAETIKELLKTYNGKVKVGH
ncbi:MAG: hypothetical protein N4A72_17465 [Bacteroidales bacterium]|jgi:hypothetical protein|nr:hypothetical protein [Bacteroidales bacterium]